MNMKFNHVIHIRSNEKIYLTLGSMYLTEELCTYPSPITLKQSTDEKLGLILGYGGVGVA